MKILFVDDEQHILDGLIRSMFDTDWEIETAISGKVALELLKTNHYDVIISDMRMPEMDGSELLNKVSELYSDSIRMILSGYSDRKLTMKATFFAHRWLDKPVDPDELIEILVRVESGLKDMPSKEIKNTICKIKSLPSPPATYAKIKQLIQSGVSSLEKVASVIEENPALAMKVLQITNSAFFSRGAETTDVNKSVVRLGIDMVTDFVLFTETYEVASENKFFNLEDEIKNSFAISKLSILISEHLSPDLSEKAKLVGLLSSIGRSVLFQAYPEKSEEYNRIISSVDDIEIITLERNLFGADHAQVGAYLLFFWGFPSDVVDGLLYYLNIEKITSKTYQISAIVHFAHKLFFNSYIDPEIINIYSLEDKLPEWKAEAELLRNL